MARQNRYAPPGYSYHVVNRGNDRKIVFRQTFDYVAFLELLADCTRRYTVRVYAYCLMPNHFHLLVEPLEEDALSAFMESLSGRYACTFRRQTNTVGHGHVFQRRFWSAAVYDDRQFLTLIRYIEANPVRGNCVCSADLWPWSSFVDRDAAARRILSPLPVPLPPRWAEIVNALQQAKVLETIRGSLVRSAGRPKERITVLPDEDIPDCFLAREWGSPISRHGARRAE